MNSEDEIQILKKIIRNQDKRIQYLEKRIINIIDNNDLYKCYKCDNYCTYDDEKCDSNIFCTNYICNQCIITIKNESNNITICKNNKCNKWYCSDCINYYNNEQYIHSCINCNKKQCLDHYISVNELRETTCNNCTKEKIDLEINDIFNDDDELVII